MSTENKALVRRWFEEVWNQGNASAIEEMLATEGIVHGLGPDSRGPAGFKPFHAAYRTAFPDVTITISKDGDQLAVQATGQPRDIAIPESDTTFRSRISPVRLSFGRNAAGQVSHLILHEANRDLVAPRK